MSQLLTAADQKSRLIAPYVTAWSEEPNPPYQLIERPGLGIAYVDEIHTDRDEQGVLWRRTISRPGKGRPEFGKVHSLRQRRAMRRLLCQVCGQPADRSAAGVLWLLQDHRVDWPDWPETMGVTEPPICRPCVDISVRLCPALRKTAVLVRVRECPIAAVQGVLYRSDGGRLVAVKAAMVTLDDPAIRWVRASSLVRELGGCTLVEKP